MIILEKFVLSHQTVVRVLGGFINSVIVKLRAMLDSISPFLRKKKHRKHSGCIHKLFYRQVVRSWNFPREFRD